MKKQILGFMIGTVIGIINPALGMIEGSSTDNDSQDIDSKTPRKTYNFFKEDEPKIWQKLIRKWTDKLETENNKGADLKIKLLVTQACIKFLETKKPFDPNAVIAYIPQEERQFVVQRLLERNKRLKKEQKEWRKIIEFQKLKKEQEERNKGIEIDDFVIVEKPESINVNDELLTEYINNNLQKTEDDTIDFYLDRHEKKFGKPLKEFRKPVKIDDSIPPQESNPTLKELKTTLKTIMFQYDLQCLKNMRSLSTIKENKYMLGHSKEFNFFDLVEMLEGKNIKPYQSNITWDLNENKDTILKIIDEINLFAIDVFIITGAFPDLKFGWKSTERKEGAPSYKDIKTILKQKLHIKNLTLNLAYQETNGPYHICKHLPSSLEALTLSNLTLNDLKALSESISVGKCLQGIKSLALPCETIIKDEKDKKNYAVYLLQLLMNCDSLKKLSFEKNKNFKDCMGGLEGLLVSGRLDELDLQEMDLMPQNLEKLIIKLNPPKQEGKKGRTKSIGKPQHNEESIYQPFDDLEHKEYEQKIRSNVNEKTITIHLKNNEAFQNNSQAINEKILHLKEALTLYYKTVNID